MYIQTLIGHASGLRRAHQRGARDRLLDRGLPRRHRRHVRSPARRWNVRPRSQEEGSLNGDGDEDLRNMETIHRQCNHIYCLLSTQLAKMMSTLLMSSSMTLHIGLPVSTRNAYKDI